MEHKLIAVPSATVDIGTGLSDMHNGFILIVTPMPTLADEAVGGWLIITGFFSLIDGIDLLNN